MKNGIDHAAFNGEKENIKETEADNNKKQQSLQGLYDKKVPRVEGATLCTFIHQLLSVA